MKKTVILTFFSNDENTAKNIIDGVISQQKYIMKESKKRNDSEYILDLKNIERVKINTTIEEGKYKHELSRIERINNKELKMYKKNLNSVLKENFWDETLQSYIVWLLHKRLIDLCYKKYLPLSESEFLEKSQKEIDFYENLEYNINVFDGDFK